jgi:TRAP-type C4-dicarboxylate transport system substrate-binding protein
MTRGITPALALIGGLFALLLPVRAQQIEIKMATLAPEGSPWYDVLARMGERWKAVSGGKVKLTIYAGGTLGDEPDMVNKLRIKQVQAVALSGAGMSDIEPGVMALQIPLLIQSYEELDYIRDRMAPTLEKMIDARGYLVLNWGDAGWVQFFTKTPVNKLDDLRKLKLFTWAGDNDELELWKTNRFKPVPLAATDILMGLKTGLIDAVPTTPLYALWNQIFGIAGYMSDVKWAPLVGATVVSKAAWEKIPADLRAQMLQEARDRGLEMRKSIRDMGDTAVKTMTQGQAGKRSTKLTVVHADDAALTEWRKETEAAYATIRGKIVPAPLFDQARQLHDEYRAKSTSTKK